MSAKVILKMMRVFAKEEICMGCGLCEVFCRVEHSESKDLVRAFKQEKALPRVRVERRKPLFLSVQCRHCSEPPCVYACLSGALQKDDSTGKVSIDSEKCIGCWTCMMACSLGAIRRDEVRHVAVKCDLCPNREVPVCVANCPNEALVYAEESQ